MAPKIDKNLITDVLNKFPNKDIRDYVFSSDFIDLANKEGVVDKEHKNAKEIFFEFFGMNKFWNTWRNVGGLLMVHCPEWPTYFIPAFTQAKASGTAHDMKKGEIPRGLITGALEGLAVGALVSGEKLKPREMGPYVILGAGLQLFSCLFFPWVGEKVGKSVYKKHLKEGTLPPAKTAACNSELTKDPPPAQDVLKPATSEKPSPQIKTQLASVSQSAFKGNLRI